MLIRKVSFSVVLIVGTMTSCQSFVMPPAFTSAGKRIGPLFDGEGEPELSPDPAVAEAETDNGSSSFMGIDEDFIPFPHRDFTAPDVVQMCMDTLTHNNKPYANAGLEVCFNFSSDRCRAAQGGSLEAFVQYAANPVFGSMIDALGWQVVSTGPIIQGTKTRGAMQTVLVNVQPRKGEERRFLWTLQQERRPPRQGCWLVYECLFVENAYSLTL